MRAPYRRRERLIPPVQPRRTPASWCVLDVTTELLDGRPGAGGPVALRHWRARVWRTHAGQLREEGEDVGCTPEGARRLLAHLSRDRSRPWVVSWGCSQVWALLDVWSYRDRSPKAVQILTDPPLALTVCPGDPRRRLWWTDARNWCPAGYPAEAPADVRLNWLTELVRGVCGLLREHLGCGPACSLGRTATDAWLALPDRGAPQTHADPAVLSLETEALWPGRCECHRIGVQQGAFALVDRRSYYPSLCLTQPVPVMLLDSGTERPVGSVDTTRAGETWIARVEVASDEPAYPAKYRGLSVWPLGRYETVLAGPELDDALYYGRVRRVLRWARYLARPVLAGYARRVLALRAAAERTCHAGLIAFAKLLGPALVGSLAQRSRRWVRSGPTPAGREWDRWASVDQNGEVTYWRGVDGEAWRQVEGGYSAHAIPAAAATITSAGRALSTQTIRCAGWENTIYWDTDGGIVTDRGLTRLREKLDWWGPEPGRLRLVDAGDVVLLTGLKGYGIGSTIRASGVPRGTVYQLAEGEAPLYDPPLESRLGLGRPPEADLCRLSQRRLDRYDHGVVLPGGTVHPFVLGGPESVPGPEVIPF